MPQLDIFIVLSTGTYLAIGFFGILAYIHVIILPNLGAIIKLRKKINFSEKNKNEIVLDSIVSQELLEKIFEKKMVFYSFILFLISFLILLTKNNFLFVLFALELILLAVNVNFIFGSLLLDDFLGQLISLSLFALAAADTSVGLALLFNYYNLRGKKIFLVSNIKA